MSRTAGSGDPTRSRICCRCLISPDIRLSCETLGLTRTNVSNHLACLRDCGIVIAEPEGRRTRYEIADAHLAQALNALVDTTLAVDDNATCLDPACPVVGCCDTGGGDR